ncbi:MAG: YebG family protein [Desulfobacterales bacterium]|jgi:dsDNA-binding SOS-regulon protein
MTRAGKKEADAYDRLLDAALSLALLIETMGGDMDETDLEELSIFLASNAAVVIGILRGVKGRSGGP